MHWLVADAQNLAVRETIEKGYEWLLLWEDDVLAPLDLFVKLNRYMKKATIPIVSGLYYLKSRITEPILYKGSGNGAFEDFKLGDKVWVDGVPTGCLLVHNSILRVMWDDSEDYITLGNLSTKKVFDIFCRHIDLTTGTQYPIRMPNNGNNNKRKGRSVSGK